MTADDELLLLTHMSAKLDALDARLAAIEAAHDGRGRLLSAVPTRCRAPGCAHLTAGALCPTHRTELP